MSNSKIELKNLGKTYIDELGNKLEVLKNVNAEFEKNKITSILAPQGSGKTSLLKILAGVESQSTGELKSNFPKIVFIPQEPSSFPWLTVKQNILDGNKNLADNELNEIIDLVGLNGYEDHMPDNRSYGFRFRISLAKALAYKADFIIVDEVFNLMSAESKSEAYGLIKKIAAKGNSFIIGTSNITEALFLSEKIYLLSSKPGEIIHQIENEESKNHSIENLTDEQFLTKRNEIENIFKKEYSQIFAKLTI